MRKAVKWNSPLYGAPAGGWFLGIHLYNRFVRATFFKGAHLTPKPPTSSKLPDTRHLDFHEQDPWNEKQLISWITQAAKLPGWGK